MKISKNRIKEIIREEIQNLNERLKRFKVYVSGESEPLILLGKNEKDVKQTAHAMIQNSSVKIKKVVKEGILNEFNKAHFLNLIKQEIESIKGQIAYSKDKVNYKGTPDWEKKEFKGVLKDLLKKLKDTEKHYKRVQKLKEGKLTEGKFKMKGKYLYMPGGEVSSLPGAYDNDALKVTIGRESFNIYKGRRGVLAVGDSYSKDFKNEKELVNWLNKSKAKYLGIDRR